MAAFSSHRPGNFIARKREYNSEAYFEAGTDSPLHLRLEGPITTLLLHENTTNMQRIATPRRILMKWSLLARTVLRGRSIASDGRGKRVLSLPNWTDLQGLHWLLEWMRKKCVAEDKDERLMTAQQFGSQPFGFAPLVAGVPVLDGADLALVFRVHNASTALEFPRPTTSLYPFILATTRARPMDVMEIKTLWECFGGGNRPLNELASRTLMNQVQHMLGGVKGDYDAIESYVAKVPKLKNMLDELLMRRAEEMGLNDDQKGGQDGKENRVKGKTTEQNGAKSAAGSDTGAGTSVDGKPESSLNSSSDSAVAFTIHDA